MTKLDEMFRRKGVLAPAGGEVEDPLGLDVENSSTNFPEDQLQVCLKFCLECQISLLCFQEMFPETNGDIGSERFDPAYFLLEHHHATTFDDLKVK